MIGFAALFALGAVWLWRTPVVPVQVGVTAPAGGPAMPAVTTIPASAPAPHNRTAAPSLSAMDTQVGTSLDALKERLFKLELRKQAGTISEDEYTQERGRAEQVLRDFLKD